MRERKHERATGPGAGDAPKRPHPAHLRKMRDEGESRGAKKKEQRLTYYEHSVDHFKVDKSRERKKSTGGGRGEEIEG